jgi:hypothetical protein
MNIKYLFLPYVQRAVNINHKTLRPHDIMGSLLAAKGHVQWVVNRGHNILRPHETVGSLLAAKG